MGRLLREGPPPIGAVPPKTTQVVPQHGILGPGEMVGQYEIIAEIGQGAMGVVYKAFDPRLRRWVAIKILRDAAADRNVVKRLEREARALARLDHRGIVTVHETGSHRGLPYVAMEYVEGESLDERIKEGKLSPREAARVVEEAARAIHHAHEKGVIHRDLKPGNILLDKEGGVRLVDFGLARLKTERLSVTATGTSLGTPAYMAPEQVRGDLKVVGPCADIYALGATLYQTLTGRPPFLAHTCSELFRQILEQEPAPLRKIRPRMPRDLERIVLKAVEKEPHRRYLSAADLAEDLYRWRTGRPILARSSSFFYRAYRHARRRPRTAILIASAAAMLGAIVFLVPILFTKSRELERRTAEASEAQHRMVARMRETAAAALEAALQARRAGDRPAMRRFAERVERTCDAVQRELPRLAETHYHRGRIERAMMRFEEALIHQERALSKDPSYAPSRYERVLLLGRRFRRRLREREQDLLVRQGFSPRLDAEEVSARDPLLRQWRETLRQDVAALKRDAGILPAKIACAEGIAEHCARRWDAAERLLERALRDDPHLEEAYEGLVLIAAARGEYARGVKWAGQGIERDRGYLPHRLSRAELRLQWGLSLREDPTPQWKAAIEDCDEVVRLEKDSIEAVVLRTRVRVQEARHIRAAGGDPGEAIGRALADADLALRIRPRSAAAYVLRAYALLEKASHAKRRGKDPRSIYTRVMEECATALRLDPGMEGAHLTRAYARINRGQFAERAGGDPREDYRGTIADAEKVLGKDPKHVEALLARAQARTNLGVLPSVRAEGLKEAERWHRLAIEDCKVAISLSPRGLYPRLVRARAYVNLGAALRDGGEDPRESYRLAVADCDEITKSEPRFADALVWRAMARLNLGHFEMERDIDPGERFQAALDDCDRALAAAPHATEAILVRITTYLNWGAFLQRKGGEAEPYYRRGVRAAEEALRRYPRWADLVYRTALLRTNWAEMRRGKGAPARDVFEKAERDWRSVEKLSPAIGEAYWRRAQCLARLGRWGEAAAAFERASLVAAKLAPIFRDLRDEAKRNRRGEE